MELTKNKIYFIVEKQEPVCWDGEVFRTFDNEIITEATPICLANWHFLRDYEDTLLSTVNTVRNKLETIDYFEGNPRQIVETTKRICDYYLKEAMKKNLWTKQSLRELRQKHKNK